MPATSSSSATESGGTATEVPRYPDGATLTLKHSFLWDAEPAAEAKASIKISGTMQSSTTSTKLVVAAIAAFNSTIVDGISGHERIPSPACVRSIAAHFVSASLPAMFAQFAYKYAFCVANCASATDFPLPIGPITQTGPSRSLVAISVNRPSRTTCTEFGSLVPSRNADGLSPVAAKARGKELNRSVTRAVTSSRTKS